MSVIIKMEQINNSFKLTNNFTQTSIEIQENTIKATQILKLLDYSLGKKYALEIDKYIDQESDPIIEFKTFFNDLLGEINNIPTEI